MQAKLHRWAVADLGRGPARQRALQALLANPATSAEVAAPRPSQKPGRRGPGGIRRLGFDESLVVGAYDPGEVIEDRDDRFMTRFLYAFWRLCAQRSSSSTTPRSPTARGCSLSGPASPPRYASSTSSRPAHLRGRCPGRAGPAPPVGGPHARPPVVAERPAPQDRLSRPVREAARQQATDRRVARRARSPPRSAAPAYGSAGDRPDSTCSCRCSRGVSCACIARRPRQARRSWSSSHRGSVTRTSPPGLVDRTTTSRYCAR